MEHGHGATARRLVGPAVSGWAIQPRVRRAELAEFDTTPEAEHLARLEGDQQLMLRLSVDGFAGAAWEKVAKVLVDYGRTVVFAWILTGMIFVKCREKGLSGPSLASPPGGIPRREAEELAQDTLAAAIVHFRDRVLKAGRWDPGKGASLATFFVGDCLLRFPNVFRRWRRRWSRQLSQVPFDSLGTLEAGDRPDDQVIGRAQVQELLESLEPGDRPVVLLHSEGYSAEEIAKLTGQTVKAVEGRLYRVRRRAKQEDRRAR